MQEILLFIKKKGIDLANMGVHNYAFPKNDALELLNLFKKYNILLYGGDFLKKEDNKFNYNYINWATNEKNIQYNIEYAKKFIEQYATEDIYIEFVTEIDFYKHIKTIPTK